MDFLGNLISYCRDRVKTDSMETIKQSWANCGNNPNSVVVIVTTATVVKLGL